MVKKNDIVLEGLRVLAWFVLIVLSFNSITALVMFIVNFIRSSATQNNYDGLGLFNHIGRHSFSIGLMILKGLLQSPRAQCHVQTKTALYQWPPLPGRPLLQARQNGRGL